MAFWEIFVIGGALAMDAVAVSLSDGMTEPRMRMGKMLLLSLCFALFQAGMPVLGYYLGSAFSSLVQKIAPYLSFALLAFIGGKMIADGVKSKGEFSPSVKTGAAEVLFQSVATSLDALAVGVALLAAETDGGLPVPFPLCALVIGVVTFALTLPAIALGKKVGDKFSGTAETAGGIVLLLIGIKLLLEGILG